MTQKYKRTKVAILQTFKCGNYEISFRERLNHKICGNTEN